MAEKKLAEPKKNKPKTIKKEEFENNNLIDFVYKNSEELFSMAKELLKNKIEAIKFTHKFRFRMSLMAVIMVSIIVICASVLTYLNKIDGSTFTFLLGLIVGYVLTYIRDSIEPDSY